MFSADQVGLATQTGPLPISISGNVQSWTSGSPLRDLYTESAQGFYQLNQNWRILGQQLYQQQGSTPFRISSAASISGRRTI